MFLVVLTTFECIDGGGMTRIACGCSSGLFRGRRVGAAVGLES